MTSSMNFGLTRDVSGRIIVPETGLQRCLQELQWLHSGDIGSYYQEQTN